MLVPSPFPPSAMDSHPVRGLDELISSCGQGNINSQDFIWHLGLPLKTAGQGSARPGRPSFDDKSGRVKDLYKLTTQVTERLVENYDSSMERLREDVLPMTTDLLEEFTAGMLAEHGDTIWSATRPLTRINPAYPRHLSFANPQDKGVIKQLLYHWIVHRAFQKLTKYGGKITIPGTTRGGKTDSGARSVGEGATDVEFLDPSSESEESDDPTDFRQTRRKVHGNKSGLGRGGYRSSSLASKPNERFAVPVAQMLPQHTPQMSISGSTAVEPYAITQWHASRSFQAVNTVVASSSQPRDSLGADTVIVQRDALHSNNTPSRETSCNKRQALSSDDEEATKKAKTIHATATESPGGASSPGKRSSLVVVLKLRKQEALGAIEVIDTAPVPPYQPPGQTSQRDREQLTVYVLNLLEAAEAGRQDLQALKDTVSCLERMAEDGVLRIMQSFGDSFEKYQATLTQWLELTNTFVEFRRLTEFDGDRNGWQEFFDGLEPERKKVARRAFYKTRLSMTELREEFGHDITETSKKVAGVLFNMASWEDMMDKDEIQAGCTRFNKSLLEWFL